MDIPYHAGGVFPNYNSVYSCIYCERTTYSKTRKELGREHIIPSALKGRFILPHAACKRCESKINKEVETPMLRRTLLLARHRTGMRFSERRASERAEFTDEATGEKMRIDLSVDQHVAALCLMQMPPPSLVFGKPRTENRVIMWTRFFDDPADVSKPIPDGSSVKLGDIFLNPYARFFAKIAHAYACARLGVNGFNPLLREFILKDDPTPHGFEFVGGLGRPEQPSRSLHSLELARQHNFIVVLVRIFANLAAPTHAVVVGTFKYPPIPFLPKPYLEEC